MNRAIVLHKSDASRSPDIRVEDMPLRDLGPTDVRVRMMFSPIHPSDVNMIEGKYATQPELPAVMGREGVGEVTDIGPMVRTIRVGDRVIGIGADHIGYWSTWVTAPEFNWWVVPHPINDTLASEIAINAVTAAAILTQFCPLKSGECIIQNAPRSSVARWVALLAKSINVAVISWDRDSVWDDTLSNRCVLGLNAVGGQSMIAMAKAIRPLGTLVTYGALSMESPAISNSALIFKEHRHVGFLRSAWLKRSPRAALINCLGWIGREAASHGGVKRTWVDVDTAAGLLQSGSPMVHYGIRLMTMPR